MQGGRAAPPGHRSVAVADGAVTVAGRRLATRWITPPGEVDRSAPVVLLHEGLGCIDMWRDFPSRLAAALVRRVFLYDRAGHGRSDPAPPRGADYLHRHARDELPAVLAAAEIDRPVLLGHSDGGTIALLYAAQAPVAALIAEAAHVFVEDAALAGIRATAERFRGGDLRERLGRYHGSLTDSLFAAWADTWLAPWFAGWDIRAELSGVHAPTLLIQGGDDPYATPGHLRAVADALPDGAETLLVPDVHHAPHAEVPDVVVAAANAFLS